MKNRKFKWVWLVVPFLMVLLFGIVYVVSAMEGLTEDEAKPAESDSFNVTSESSPESVKSEANETNETSDPVTKISSEEDFMQAIHQMTHQKVKAYPKWGSLEITDERIQDMLNTLSGVDYKNETFYQETLEAWKNGDFSNVITVHNQIWEWRDGTIGKASRALTAEEETKFIDKHF